MDTPRASLCVEQPWSVFGLLLITNTALLVEMLNMTTLAVIQLLEPQCFRIEILKHSMNALLHVR